MLPQLVFVITGRDDEEEGGYGFEFISTITNCVQNYIAKDPETFLNGTYQEQAYHTYVLKLVHRVLQINRNSKHKLDGVAVLKIIIAMIENLPGRIDALIPSLFNLTLEEFNLLSNEKKPNQAYM